MYSNLMRLLKKRGLTPYRLCKDTGISQATLTSWKNGAYTPKLEKLRIIADYLSVSVTELTGDGGERRVPIVGSIACGSPIFAEENIEGYAAPSYGVDCDFCLFAKGDSMQGARIFDGDLVFIRQQPMVENGEIAAVLIEESATLKRLYFYPNEKKLVLSPENPKYAPIVLTGEEISRVSVLGKAVAFQSEVR